MKTICLLLVSMTSAVFIGYGISDAAYFEGMGSHFSLADTIDIDMSDMPANCSDTDTSSGTSKIRIMPSSGEQVGDPVTVSYCWSATGSTHITNGDYKAVAGIGQEVSVNSNCTSNITSNATGPAIIQLIHNGNPSAVFSYPATIIQNNQTISEPLTCSSFQAQIGDEIQGVGGVFAGLAGPTPDQGTNASLTFTFEASLQSSASIPTLNEWGMILLSLAMAGAGLVYMKRRRQDTL